MSDIDPREDALLIESESVQQRAGGAGSFLFLGTLLRSGGILPDWGTPQREYALRMAYYDEHNTLVNGGLDGLFSRLTQTPWEISGDGSIPDEADAVHYWQAVLQEADLGEGWDTYLFRTLFQLAVQDIGAVTEIIGPGEPDEPLEEAWGIRALDSLRCYLSDDPECPVWYHSTNGGIHKLHHTRVLRFVFSPSADPQYRGLGKSLMSRAFAVAEIQRLMSEYNVEKLDKLPPEALVAISGISEQQRLDIVNHYWMEREARRGGSRSRVSDPGKMVMSSPSPDKKIEFSMLELSTVPPGFSYRETMETHVNLVALALGVDPQDIWPLTGAPLGTGAQSKILHAKGRAKTEGQIRQMLERAFNLLLPEGLRFEFKPEDSAQDLERAQIAGVWIRNATAAVQGGLMTPQQGQLFMTATVKEAANVFLDADGQLRLPDVDKVDPDATPLHEVVATDDTPLEQEGSAPPSGEGVTPVAPTAMRAKSIQATRIEFEDSFEDLLRAAVSGAMNRQRFGIVARALISRAGRDAYRNALQEHGITPEDMEPDDFEAIDRITREAVSYVSALSDEVFKEGVTEAQLAGKPAMWWNGSVLPFYNAGLMSADQNGMYMWVLGQTEQHCKDCARLDGQIHRFRSFADKNLLPGTVGQDTECLGYNCDCKLLKTTDRARGGF